MHTYLLTYLLTYSMVQSPSWEANWFAASQEILRISRKPKVHYRTHNRPPAVSILGQPNPVHIPTYHLLEIRPNITYLLTYLLTPWCRVLLEKLTVLHLVKKFPAFHGTRRFITALTTVRHLSLSWASPIQSIYPHSTSWRSILILSTHLRLGLPGGSFPPVSPPRPYTPPSPHPYAPHAQPILFFSFLSPAQYWVSSTNHLAPRYAISSIPPLPRPS